MAIDAVKRYFDVLVRFICGWNLSRRGSDPCFYGVVGNFLLELVLKLFDDRWRSPVHYGIYLLSDIEKFINEWKREKICSYQN